MDYKVSFPEKKLKAEIQLPSSKSISNRLLIINACCNHQCAIENLSDANDTKILTELLQQQSNDYNVQDAGTAFRFLTAYLATKNGKHFLCGTDRLHERPIAPLVNALRLAGANIEYAKKENFAPLIIHGKKLKGGSIKLNSGESSQFLSALLMIAPTCEEGMEIEVAQLNSSVEYVRMTIELMKQHGIKVEQVENKFIVKPQEYIPRKTKVESDWSAASFWYEAVMLCDDAEITLKNISSQSLQGDLAIIKFGEALGVETLFSGENILLRKIKPVTSNVVFDLMNCPDLAPPLAVAMAANNFTGTFSGLKNLDAKESKRGTLLSSELKKINANVLWKNDSLTFHPSQIQLRDNVYDSHHDHRLAMSFAFLSIKFLSIVIRNGESAKKSYPQFWKHLADAGFKVNN